MPPKGRGRGRGGERQNQPGGGQGRPGDAPPQRSQPPPPGFQGPPQGAREDRPLPQQQPQPPKSHKQEANIEDLGIQFKHKMGLSSPFPAKPAAGRLGRPIKLISNCYSMELPSGDFFHYDVEIHNQRQSTTTCAPGKEGEKKEKDTKYRCMNTKRNREVIAQMMRDDPNFRRVLAAYDGRKNMYTRHPLSFIKGDTYKFTVTMMDEPGNPNDPRGPRTDVFEVTIKPVRKKETNDCAVSLDPLHALFQGKVNTVPQEAIMAIETVLRHGPCLRYVPVGRSFFYPPGPNDVHPLGGGKEIWFGYHQSLRLGQWKPMVNLDITATTFYEKKGLLDYVADLLLIRGGPDMLAQRPLKDHEIMRLTKELKTMRIETNHLKNYKRKYRILRFTRESADRLQFEITENGATRKITVAEYFRTHYRPLKYPHLPCIQGNPEAKKVYLPIEVCEMQEGQHCKKKLEERQNAEMIKFTARAPKKRFAEIADICKRADFSRDEYLKEFGIRVSAQPLALEGRVLDAPNVLYLQGNQTTKVTPRDGQWDMRDKQYFRPAQIDCWVLLSFAQPRYCAEEQLGKFARLLCNIAGEQGIRINRPATIEIVDPRSKPMKTILGGIQKRFNANFVVVVVPANNKAVYGEVKVAAETGLNLVTQCIKDDSVVKKCNPPLVSNLCQKINAKMGGVNNALTPGETPEIMRRPVIIIGADVTHPGPSHEIKPSIAAAVGSLDAHPSRYAVTIRAQTNVDERKQAVEIILELKSMVIELLKAFHRHTKGKKPEKIIFYRDGVSEGQFATVRDHEVKCIREACRELGADYQPGITFLVVQKRHHTRFMPQDDRQGSGKMRNIPPGTTVDKTVTHPLNYDFFLCSHFGLQGTSRPCHYTVIEDDNNFTSDDLHKLTYYLCHTYVRCTKSISSPAPVMYAHLAAFRARQHLLGLGDESSASSSISTEYHPLKQEILDAIQTTPDMKNAMYYV